MQIFKVVFKTWQTSVVGIVSDKQRQSILAMEDKTGCVCKSTGAHRGQSHKPR